MLLYIGEDDLALAAGMKFTLEREEYEVETFGTCGALREAMGRRKPDLLLLDWNLPDGDGLELCRRIKEREDIPALMITARDLEIDQVMCLEGGADDYIAKPFSLSVLKARIRALLRRSGGQSRSGEEGGRAALRETLAGYKEDAGFPRGRGTGSFAHPAEAFAVFSGK